MELASRPTLSDNELNIKIRSGKDFDSTTGIAIYKFSQDGKLVSLACSVFPARAIK